MHRAIATLLLLAHVGIVGAPSLAEAGMAERATMTHCVPASGDADAAVAQTPKDCDACQMPDCLGTAGCAHAGFAVVSTTSIAFTPDAGIVTVLEGSSGAANLLHTPLPPPPKS